MVELKKIVEEKGKMKAVLEIGHMEDAIIDLEGTEIKIELDNKTAENLSEGEIIVFNTLVDEVKSWLELG